MAVSPSLFEKMNAGFADLPVVSGANVFVTSEYAKAIGLSCRQTRERLQRLLTEGKVQKVRTRRGGKMVSAWQYKGR